MEEKRQTCDHRDAHYPMEESRQEPRSKATLLALRRDFLGLRIFEPYINAVLVNSTTMSWVRLTNCFILFHCAVQLLLVQLVDVT